MATFSWEVYANTPDWFDIAANTIVFSGSSADLTAAITVAAWQDGTHLGNNDPGTDQCGTTHVPNVKFITTTEFDSGGGTEALNDTNLVQTECTFRVNFTDGASVSTSSARLYAFNGASVVVPAVAVDVYAFQQGVTATAWTEINEGTAPTGGDNVGERLNLADQGAATAHTFYIATSASPESVGSKTEFDYGIALVYS
jgi:hypothetical protein